MEAFRLNRAAFRRQLGAWFARHQRALPWRTERSAYRTVVSEFMLQQTQVATVLPYFERWMAALPDFRALATANEQQVLKLWEGLGYYRRARNLHALAKQVAALPELPRTAPGWQELPGIGPYTAAAVASIAFGDPVACVDGNVVRILARLTGDDQLFSDGSKAVKHFMPLAAALLDPKNPGQHNEAMMELGATICVRRRPWCTVCPVRDHCVAGRGGFADELPRIKRSETEKQTVDRVWIVHRGRLLLHRIPDDASRMNGLYELPTQAQVPTNREGRADGVLLATHQRSITRYRITERIFAHKWSQRGPKKLPADLRWVALDQLETVTLSGPHRRWITGLLQKRSDLSGEP